jgi:hypothetical protein
MGIKRVMEHKQIKTIPNLAPLDIMPAKWLVGLLTVLGPVPNNRWI